MTDIRFEHTESTVSSVRSTVSTASSGYAVVSVPGRHRGDVRTMYPTYPDEPPPDYDEEGPVDKDDLLHEVQRPTGSRQSSPIKGPEKESKIPLLLPETSQTNGNQQTIVRINSKSQDINIEIVSNPTQSPASTTAESSFLYHTPKRNRFRDRKCCKFTFTEKILLGAFVIVSVGLVLVILNFTACIGDFTSACE